MSEQEQKVRGLENLKRLAEMRDAIDRSWRDEIVKQSDVYSVRAIAEAANVSHTQVWRMIKANG